MRRFFEPASAPSWLKPVLTSIRAALGDVWHVPVRPFRAATSDFPPAAEHDGGLAYDETALRPAFSDGSSWITLAAYDADVAAIAALSTTGLIARTGAGTAATRTITGTANEITVTNGDGVAGNPTLSLPSAITAPGSITATTTLHATTNLSCDGNATLGNAAGDNHQANGTLTVTSTITQAAGAGTGTAILRGGSGGGVNVGQLDFDRDGSGVLARIETIRSGANDAGALVISTKPTGGSLTERARIAPGGGLDLATGNVLSVNGTQVVTAQQAAVADATGAGDVVAQLNAMLARLRTHGLIAT